MIEVTFRAYNEFHEELKRSTQANFSLGLVSFLSELQGTLSLVTECICVRVMGVYEGNHIVVGHFLIYLDNVIPISAECFREYSILRQKDAEFI